MTTTKQAILYKNIMNKLAFEPGLDASNILVGVKGEGIIVLGGEVPSYAEKRIAEQALQKVRGVKGIANELHVNLALPYHRNDAEILNAALENLKWNIFVPEDQIKLTVESGCIILSGKVERYYQKEQAEKSVSSLLGVTGVINNILLENDIISKNIKEEIMEEFERNSGIGDDIQVEVSNDRAVTLTGLIRDFDEGREARIIAWSVPGVRDVIDKLQINYW